MVGSRCVADWPKDPSSEARRPFPDEAPGTAGRVYLHHKDRMGRHHRCPAVQFASGNVVQRQTRMIFLAIFLATQLKLADSPAIQLVLTGVGSEDVPGQVVAVIDMRPLLIGLFV